jgi:hypothetical protein
VRLLGPGISESASHLDVRYRFRLTWVAGVGALFGASAIYARDYLAVAIITGCLAAILLVASFVLRLTADSTGIRVVNWSSALKLSWNEVADVETVPTPQGTTIQLRANDGRKIKVTALWDFSYEDAHRIAERLRHMQHHAVKASR